MSTSKTSTAMTTVTRAGGGVNNKNHCARQYQSAPIDAQVINGTVTGVIRVAEAAGTDNYCAQMVIRVVSNDGTTERGVLFAFNGAALTAEFASSLAVRGFPREVFPLNGETLTEVTAQAGDRIIVGLGFRQTSTSTGNASFVFGDDDADDYLFDASDTAEVKNPWIEFSQTITFQGAGTMGSARRFA